MIYISLALPGRIPISVSFSASSVSTWITSTTVSSAFFTGSLEALVLRGGILLGYKQINEP